MNHELQHDERTVWCDRCMRLWPASFAHDIPAECEPPDFDTQEYLADRAGLSCVLSVEDLRDRAMCLAYQREGREQQ